MLYRLVRTNLTPYAAPLAVLLVLQVIGTLASLYLPSLNGQIIDEGVAVGDTAFILRTGAVMLVVSLVQVLATIGATRIGAQTSASLGRDVRSSVFSRVGEFSAQELLPVRGSDPREPEHQRRHPGPDGRQHVPRAHGVGPDHDGRRHLHGPARGPRPGLARGRRGAGARRRDRPDHRPDGAALPRHAEVGRLGQPHPARADHRRAGRACLRPRGRRAAAVRRCEPHLHGDGARGGQARWRSRSRSS